MTVQIKSRGRHAARGTDRTPTVQPMQGWAGRLLALLAGVAVMGATLVYLSSDADAATPKRHVAIKYAKAQRGDWYKYGGTGPSRWDCSGLVYVAYKKAGITLPRTTYGMLKSSKLQRTSKPKWGDLVFTSSGHVEFFTSKGLMFGAHRTGTRVSYAHIYSGARGYPKYFHVRGAG